MENGLEPVLWCTVNIYQLQNGTANIRQTSRVGSCNRLQQGRLCAMLRLSPVRLGKAALATRLETEKKKR